MKHHLKVISSLLIFSLVMGNVDAQTKAKTKIRTAGVTTKAVERKFGTPTAITDITDESDSTKEFHSLQNLIEKDGVILTYDDNTFRGKDPLRRGDFIVALNSSLDGIKKVADQYGLDSSVFNTYDRNASYVTSASELTDLKEESIYYPATKSLIEKWGVAAPFTKAKKLNAGAPMTEKEVYDILNVVYGYDNTGLNPYAGAMSRAKFATVLNNAVAVKLQQVNAMKDKKDAEAEQVRQQEKMKMAADLKAQEQMKRDSANSAYKAEQAEIERKAVEAQSKKKHKN